MRELAEREPVGRNEEPTALAVGDTVLETRSRLALVGKIGRFGEMLPELPLGARPGEVTLPAELNPCPFAADAVDETRAHGGKHKFGRVDGLRIEEVFPFVSQLAELAEVKVCR